MATLRQLYELLEEDVGQMLATYTARIERHDEVRLDRVQRTATFFKEGARLWQAHAEPLGRLNPAFGQFRWWWHGHARPPSGRPSRLDAIMIDGLRFRVAELTTDPVTIADGEEATMLATVAARLAGAEGMVRVDDAHGALFVALFESPGVAVHSALFPSWTTLPAQRLPDLGDVTAPSDGNQRYSIPPAHVIVTTSGVSVPTSPLRSPAPLPNAPVGEPRREVLAPLLQTVFSIASTAMPGGVTEVLLVVIVDVLESGARYFVQAVALTPESQLVSLDTSIELAQETERMLEADTASGNGRWSKLVARMRRTARGASVEVEVKA